MEASATLAERTTGADHLAASELLDPTTASHARAAATVGPRAVWEAAGDQPNLTPELEAERTELMEDAYGDLDQWGS